MTKKAKKRIGLASIGLFLVVIGFGLIANRGDNAQANPAAEGAAPQAMPVPVEIIEKKPLRIWTSYSGRMAAVDYVELRPEVGGRIDEIKFEDGQLVNKGDVLFVIDPRPYEASVKQAEAALKSAKNQKELALKELKRAEDLLKTDAVPKRIYDERQSTAEISKNAIEEAQAQLTRAKIDLDHAYIKSPISGRISRPEITVGNVVQAGPSAPILTTIVSNEGIYADFEIDEQTYLRNIRGKAAATPEEGGIPVRLTVGGRDEMSYEGYVHSFDNRINPSSGTIRARAYFNNADGALLPGMYASIRMGSPTAEDVILLTDQAISTDQDRKFVYIVNKDSKAEYREVKLGTSVDGHHVIASGLQAGDKVIVDGLMKIRPDMPVAPQVKKPKQPAALVPASPKTP